MILNELMVALRWYGLGNRLQYEFPACPDGGLFVPNEVDPEAAFVHFVGRGGHYPYWVREMGPYSPLPPTNPEAHVVIGRIVDDHFLFKLTLLVIKGSLVAPEPYSR